MVMAFVRLMRRRTYKKSTPQNGDIPSNLREEPFKRRSKCKKLALVVIMVQLCTLRWFWLKLSTPLLPLSVGGGNGNGREHILVKKSFPSEGEEEISINNVVSKAYEHERSEHGNDTQVTIDSVNDVDVNVDVNIDNYRVEIVTACPNAAVYAYLRKDALVYITLTEDSPMHWSGTFSCPIAGEYELIVKASECGDGNGDGHGSSKLVELPVTTFRQQVDTTDLFFEKEGVNFLSGLISKAAWFSSSKVQIDTPSSSQQQPPDYVWINPTAVKDEKQVKSIKEEDGFVFDEGSVIEGKGFFEFKKLSNYELVCFFGSQSAKDLHGSLLSLRGTLFPNQRPFKFHYYEVSNFDNPDEGWTQETKEKFRKCKHVLVSIDEPETPLSQTEYKSKMITLINHLVLAFDDETFPLIIFTSMESPVNPKNCHSPAGKRTSEHPCNTVLKEIFSHSPVLSRVRLLDNTDLTYPIGGDNLRSDALLSIAMRIFIIVGYQVQDWRANKQLGHTNGLTRGDKEYPNFELIPYDWTSVVSSDNVKWLKEV